MANKFLRALAKVKLVELDQSEMEAVEKDAGEDLTMEEVDRILATEGKQAAPPPKPAPPKPAPPPPQPVRHPGASDDGEIVEGRPFADIYLSLAVPEAPYSAEKLLRVLDGLKAMDPGTRKAAVIAMDAADEEWTLADAVLDAQRKIRALDQTATGIGDQLRGIQEQADHDKAKRDQYLAEATATIQKKIQELEETLQNEIATISAQKAEIDGKVSAAIAAATREQARLRAEVQRLEEIPATFAVERSE